MAGTYTNLGVHLVFATKGRRPLIEASWRERMHAYLGGTAHRLGATPIAVGGVDDHIHMLVGLRATHAVADVVRELKKASNAWVRTETGASSFGWQEGYAAFSVSADIRAATIAYIDNQESHHRTKSSLAELRDLLAEAGIDFDEQYFE